MPRFCLLNSKSADEKELSQKFLADGVYEIELIK